MLESVVIISVIIWGASMISLHRLNKYEFENRTSAGVVEFQSYTDALNHSGFRSFWLLVRTVSGLIALGGFAILCIAPDKRYLQPEANIDIEMQNAINKCLRPVDEEKKQDNECNKHCHSGAFGDCLKYCPYEQYVVRIEGCMKKHGYAFNNITEVTNSYGATYRCGNEVHWYDSKKTEYDKITSKLSSQENWLCWQRSSFK